MYVLVAGGGKVGANVARTLLRLGHEVTLIEQRRPKFEALEAIASLLDQRHLVAEAHERARDVRADLPAACHDDVHAYAETLARGISQARTASVRPSIAIFVGQNTRTPSEA